LASPRAVALVAIAPGTLSSSAFPLGRIRGVDDRLASAFRCSLSVSSRSLHVRDQALASRSSKLRCTHYMGPHGQLRHSRPVRALKRPASNRRHGGSSGRERLRCGSPPQCARADPVRGHRRRSAADQCSRPCAEEGRGQQGAADGHVYRDWRSSCTTSSPRASPSRLGKAGSMCLATVLIHRLLPAHATEGASASSARLGVARPSVVVVGLAVLTARGRDLPRARSSGYQSLQSARAAVPTALLRKRPYVSGRSEPVLAPLRASQREHPSCCT